MTPVQWATEIVETLQGHGYQSYFAGGCVRDAVLGITPKDYDVATAATPDQVQSLFGRKRTLAIGKSFGVITVLGPRSAGNIEVATFRRDGKYSDGRRPDSVEFTDAKEDAMRRDFTINGMFFDPVRDTVIDYVGGIEDIDRKIVRAIGNARQRIEEDKLRMLRGVRFAASYGFELERETMAAITERASQIRTVSPERIGAEVRRMLGGNNKSIAFSLLLETSLWQHIFPCNESKADWQRTAQLLSFLKSDFPTALAAIFRSHRVEWELMQDVWRLKNDEIAKAKWIVEHESILRSASQLRWSQLQPVIISPHVHSGLDLLDADLNLDDDPQLARSIEQCRKHLAEPEALLDPPPLIDGATLKNLGIVPGPRFKTILDSVRAMQLDGELKSRDEAMAWIQDRFADESS